MSVTIRLRNSQAIYEHGRWRSNDPELEAVLNLTIEADQRSPSQPRPDLVAAELAVAATGAKIVNVSPAPPSPDGTVY